MRRIPKKLFGTILVSTIISIFLVARQKTSVTELSSHVMSACEAEAARQLRQAQDGQQVSHEWELAPASLFTAQRVFPAEPGLGGRVVEKVMGARREDLALVVSEAVETLQKQTKSKYRYDHDDFVEGIFRSEPRIGVQYELIFRNKTNINKCTKVYLQRPYAPINLVAVESNVNTNEQIHILLPLSGRQRSFQSFMERFYKISQYDQNIILTVVYFGLEYLNETKVILDSFKVNDNPRLIVLNEPFSRAKALRVGASQWADVEDVLLFFCDVDVVFTSRFLERCRWNTSPGTQVYYPIVFSLYNPHVVYKLHGKQIPSENEQLIISKQTGFWRDFGYGMTCQYRSDFLRAYEKSLERTSWGGEDVALYRKFLRNPRIRVLRVTDAAIFHLWHGKRCEPRVMSPAQLRACLHSRARNEASHSQLGLLAFKDYQSYVWRH